MHIVQSGFFDFLVTLLLWVPKMVVGAILAALSSLLNAIPVPAWLTSAAGWFNGIPAGVIYFSQALEIPAGLAIVLSAYGIRFLIRRIPLIG